MEHAMFSHASRGYQCPLCSCGAVSDWKKEAPLRCTGCKTPLITYEQHEYEERQSLRAQLAAAQEELAKLREDAERYRWIKDNSDGMPPWAETDSAWENLDAAIDAARKEKSNG